MLFALACRFWRRQSSARDRTTDAPAHNNRHTITGTLTSRQTTQYPRQIIYPALAIYLTTHQLTRDTLTCPTAYQLYPTAVICPIGRHLLAICHFCYLCLLLAICPATTPHATLRTGKKTAGRTFVLPAGSSGRPLI